MDIDCVIEDQWSTLRSEGSFEQAIVDAVLPAGFYSDSKWGLRFQLPVLSTNDFGRSFTAMSLWFDCECVAIGGERERFVRQTCKSSLEGSLRLPCGEKGWNFSFEGDNVKHTRRTSRHFDSRTWTTRMSSITRKSDLEQVYRTLITTKMAINFK